MKKNLCQTALAAFVSLLPLCGAAQTRATVTEEMKSMPTYPYSDPNPVAEPESSIYPYFLFDGYSHKSVPQEWKVVTLENEYIRVTIFPQIGGKLWGAYDKINQKEFVYTNDAVKFRNIAMRGPWTSGGIEFNFGIIGHEPTTSSPVDYLTRQNEDGSASCFIASYDWVTRNYWGVEIRLPKDKAYFTTHSTIYNTTAIDQPYYQWMNGAFSAQNNAEFVYPGNSYMGHAGDIHPFPVEDGHEISWYEKNNFIGSKSYHINGYYSDHFGIYWHGIDYGSIHHSNYDEKLGMKIFLWSLARNGAIWEDLLTDNHGQYIEMQSGRMFNQPVVESGYTPYKNNAINAQATDTWTEYWYPVSGTKGVVKTCRLGTLNVLRNATGMQLLFSPIQKINTTVKVYQADKLVKEMPLKADVLQTWTGDLNQVIPQGQLKVIIGDQQLVYSESKDDFELRRPKVLPADFDWNSAYGLYVKGEQHMNSLMYADAEKFLCQSIEKDKYFAPALVRLASLYVHQAKYNQALELLQRVLSLNAYDDEGNYLYGLCNNAMGRITDAKDGFSIASISPAFRSSSYQKLAEIYFCEDNKEKAEHYALMSLDYNVKNIRTLQLLSVLYRQTGRTDEAKAKVKTILDMVPLFPGARYEATCLGLSTFEKFVAEESCEMPQETFMEEASWYESINCYDDAIKLFDLAKSSPIALIRKSYIQHKQGNNASASSTLAEAIAMKPDYVFPFRVEDIPALRYAVNNTNSWKPRYYLAELLLAKHQKKEALTLMADSRTSDYAPYYLLAASLAEGADRLATIQKAEQIEPSWRVGRELIKYYESQADYMQVVKIGEKYLRRYPQNYMIALSLAKGYMEIGNNTASLKLLAKTHILPYEGARDGYVAYRLANLQEAVNQIQAKSLKRAEKYIQEALKYPENLGVGKPFDEVIDARVENYLLSLVYANDAAKSKSYLAKVTTSKPYRENKSFNTAELLVALALKAEGKAAEADKLCDSWKGSSPVVAWCKAIYQGDKAKAAEIASAMKQGEKGIAPIPFIHFDGNSSIIYRLLK
ncbi:MAG: DUF5107 domain-containing protein [Bacteroidales bacterium]|nr:DUF5107 domain-containing protein [Bacteroidales bacterium]